MIAKKTTLVTGVAGFIGSHLAQRLLSANHAVIGIDSFTDYYDRKIKETNISDLFDYQDFRFIESDLVEMNLKKLNSIDWVFHQAAQAGVRASWGKEFALYTHNNVLATQRLLEWARVVQPERFIYASSSSVYGRSANLPMQEEDLPRPLSPYGVSKLAAEHLCNLYHDNFNLPTVSLRYFTVYGPRQRPDMAFHRFIRAILDNEPIVIYGSGDQTRDFTFIDDIIDANLAAAKSEEVAGNVYNIGGGSRISVNGVLAMLEKITGKKAMIEKGEIQAGDPPHTYADTAKAAADLGYKPGVPLEKGLEKMFLSFSSTT